MMKYLLLLSIIWTCSSFAKQPKEQLIYDFKADNSYLNEKGKCVKSALQISLVANKLIVKSSNLPAEIVELDEVQLEGIKNLAGREAEQVYEVSIPFGKGTTLKLIGDTCGRLQCDFAQVLFGNKVIVEYILRSDLQDSELTCNR